MMKNDEKIMVFLHQSSLMDTNVHDSVCVYIYLSSCIMSLQEPSAWMNLKCSSVITTTPYTTASRQWLGEEGRGWASIGFTRIWAYAQWIRTAKQIYARPTCDNFDKSNLTLDQKLWCALGSAMIWWLHYQSSWWRVLPPVLSQSPN